MNDLWKFSGGEWTWVSGPRIGGQNGNYGTLGVPSANGIPGARFESVSWTDATGNFWLFGGLGFDSVGSEASLNDLWKYSAGKWTWVGGSAVANKNGTYGTIAVADPRNMPGARDQAVVWTTSSGDVWLFGGLGYDESSATVGLLSDLWSYSAGQWTWMGGPKVTTKKVFTAHKVSLRPIIFPALGLVPTTGSMLPAISGCSEDVPMIPPEPAVPSTTCGSTAVANGPGLEAQT
jgi:hypothetical protein